MNTIPSPATFSRMAVNLSSSIILIALCCLSGVGCSGEAAQIEKRQSTESAYDEAVACMEAKDYARADELFVVARDGELPIDLYTAAGFQHAECLAQLQKFSEALIAIDMVAEGSSADEIHLAKCRVYLVQGDKTKAKEEFDLARAENPNVKQPAGL